MTHADLVMRACRWLKSHRQCGLVFAEACKNVGIEQPDALGFKNGVSHVVECKVSRADFFADPKKAWKKFPRHGLGMGMFRWYAVPAGLVADAEVPPDHGLLWVHPRTVEIVRNAAPREAFNAESERDWLYCTTRRHTLGVRWIAKEFRFETIDEGDARRAAEGAKGAA